jgi:hypothetical protein
MIWNHTGIITFGAPLHTCSEDTGTGVAKPDAANSEKGVIEPEPWLMLPVVELAGDAQ